MRQNLYANFFRFFASLRLTVVVLTVLALACLTGMFWDQTLSLEEHLGHLAQSPIVTTAFQIFELNDVFHSWWFSIVVVLLALNLIGCSIERLPKIWLDARYPLKTPSEREFRKMTHKAFATRDSLERAESAILKLFGKNTQKLENEEGIFFFKEKHKYARCGVYIVHISLLMIMFGSVATTTFGVDGLMMIDEGTAQQVVYAKGPGGLRYPHDLGFYVACSDFRLKTFTDNSPMAYESDLSIIDGDKASEPTVKKTIKVNEPLTYKGYTFYQASYQPVHGEQSLKMAFAAHGKDPREVITRIGDRVPLSDGGALVPIEVIDEFGGLGEALKVQYIPKAGEVTSFVVFRQYPDFDPMVRRGEWDVFFHGHDQKYATGISVGKVPFLPVVFAGFIGLFIGMYMAFMQNQRRYYARIRQKDDGSADVLIAAVARRHIHAFAEEFQVLTSSLEKL